jgi:hypothetical protein
MERTPEMRKADLAAKANKTSKVKKSVSSEELKDIQKTVDNVSTRNPKRVNYRINQE